MKLILKKTIIKLMKRRGYSEFATVNLCKDLFDDLMNNKDFTIKNKLWAYKRGFLSSKINDYGLTNENYDEYLSDFDYYKLYPLNSKRWSKFIDDKLTTKYILSKYNTYLPQYYFNIKDKSTILPLQDYNSKKMLLFMM